MNEPLLIKVPAVPVGQPRQRHRIAGKGAKQFVQNYTPKDDKSNTYKATVRLAASEVYSGPPLTGPLRVDIDFILERHRAKVWKTKPMPRYWSDTKPDRDNLDKGTLDALSGLLWVDDAQVCDGRIRKLRAAGDEQPHVLITVTQLEN